MEVETPLQESLSSSPAQAEGHEAKTTPQNQKHQGSNRNRDAHAANGQWDWTPNQDSSTNPGSGLGGSSVPLAKDTHHGKSRRGSDGTPQPGALTTTTRRNANGTVSSVYNGNRVRYLKKEDGEPLWRSDIQFAFLQFVFNNDAKVFTNVSNGTSGHTFAEIYVDAMAKSSKTSMVLKEKLATDKSTAVDMAMICLLVNVGRMNTTLNFFPEMRARVRTYHSIPALQAHQSPQAYKQLQDGPRLKSILKGATEDTPQPGTIEEIMNHPKPRTNPVNLIFVLSQYAPRVSEMHFPPPRDWWDLFLKKTLSSASRANAFLWLMWWYLESDFSEQDCHRNPFATTGEVPVFENGVPKVPGLQIITEEQAAAENADTEEEVVYAEAKKREREAVAASLLEQHHNYRFRQSPYGSSVSDSSEGHGRHSQSPPSSRNMGGSHGRSSKIDHDPDRTRSPSPPALATSQGFQAINAPPPPPPNLVKQEIKTALSSSATAPSTHHSGYRRNPENKGVGRGNWQRKPKENPAQLQEILPMQRRSSSKHPPPAPPQSSTHLGQHPVALPVLVDGSIHLPQQQFHSHTSAASPYNTLTTGWQEVQNGSPVLYVYHNGVPTNPQCYPPGHPIREAYVNSLMGGLSAGNSGKRSKPPISYQQQVEQNKRMQVDQMLQHEMHQIQRAKKRERLQRGVVVDAWIKCVQLPEGWDSEEDEFGRLGGIDDVNRSNTGRRSDAGEDDAWGDLGARKSTLARALRRAAKVLDGVTIGEKRRRREPRAEWQEAVVLDEMGVDEFGRHLDPTANGLPHGRGSVPGYAFPHDVAFQPASRSGSIATEDVEGTSSKKKRPQRLKPLQSKRPLAAKPNVQPLNSEQGVLVNEPLTQGPQHRQDHGAQVGDGLHRRGRDDKSRGDADNEEGLDGQDAVVTQPSVLEYQAGVKSGLVDAAALAHEEDEMDELDRELLEVAGGDVSESEDEVTPGEVLDRSRSGSRESNRDREVLGVVGDDRDGGEGAAAVDVEMEG